MNVKFRPLGTLGGDDEGILIPEKIIHLGDRGKNEAVDMTENGVARKEQTRSQSLQRLLIKKLGLSIDLRKRPPGRALPDWIVRALAFNRVKD